MMPTGAAGADAARTCQLAEEEAATFASAHKSCQDILYELIKGNRRYTSGAPVHTLSCSSPLEDMLDDPYRTVHTKAVVVACACVELPIDVLFDAVPGELQSIIVMGNTCVEHDGVVGSVDYALSESEEPPPLLLILGTSQSEPVQAALRASMAARRMINAPPSNLKLIDVQEQELALIKRIKPACDDAVLQMPEASFEKLTAVASKLNIWSSIETFITKSPTIARRVANGSLQIHGAFLDVDTGVVHMLGEHPAKAKLLRVPPASDVVRTASAPPVPAEEALAALIAGNRRYHVKQGRTSASSDNLLLMQLSEGGQNPIAVVLGCADSRAPVEILFDMRPGDLFVLRTAGNALAKAKGSLIGSAEYAISHLRTKLVVVTGHTKCGAVTEAVKAVRANADLKQVAGSIGDVLENIIDGAIEAVKQKPDASVTEQVALATKLNVFDAMKRMIIYSEIIKQGVATMDLQVHGAVYDIFTGKVEWLGQHPQLEGLISQRMPLYSWKVTPYLLKSPRMSPGAHQVIEQLRKGNQSFASQARNQYRKARVASEPLAIVVYGTEVRVSLQRLFDVAPGTLVCQRCLGNIAGAPGGTLFASLEYAVERYLPKVLLILGYSDSDIIKYGIEQALGSETPPLATRTVLDRIGVSAVRALEEVGKQTPLTAAGAEMKVMRLAVEFNVLYAIERLILTSHIVRQAIQQGMELQGAILDHVSGEVEFLGSHPMNTELLALGGRRHEGATTAQPSQPHAALARLQQVEPLSATASQSQRPAPAAPAQLQQPPPRTSSTAQALQPQQPPHVIELLPSAEEEQGLSHAKEGAQEAESQSVGHHSNKEELKREDRHEMAEAEGVENGHAEPPEAQEES